MVAATMVHTPVRAQADTRLRDLVDAHFAVVWRTLKRLGVPEEGVDDSVQQVFLVADRKRSIMREGEERKYLIGIAVKVAADSRRARARRREVLGDEAILARDFPVILTLNFFAAALTLAGTLLSDVLYAVVDPRIRLG